LVNLFGWFSVAMATISAFEAKTRFGHLLERVARGEEVIITKHDKPVARLIPEGRRNLQSVRDAIADLRELRRRIAARTRGKSRVSFRDFKSAVEEGRE
jgi:prevent-host-death family protein